MPVDTSIYGQAQAPNALQQMGQAIGVANGAQQLQAGQFDLLNKQLGVMRSSLSSLLADPNAGPADAIQAASKLVAQGILSPQMWAEEAKSMPQDPAGFRGWLTTHLANTLDAQQKLNAVYGTPQTLDAGNRLVTQAVSPITGVHPLAGGTLPTAMSPAQAAQPVEGPPGPGGAPTRMPLGGFAERTGMAQPGTYSGQPAAPARPAQPTARPAQPSQGSQPGPQASAPGGAMVVGLPPGQAEAASHVGAASGNQLAGDRQAGANYTREIFPLEQAIPALERLGPTGTGPGTETTNHIKSFLQSAGMPGVDASKIKDFDEAKKYLTDFVNQNGNTATNDKLAAAFAGNPSVGISNAAAVDVAKSALSLRRMKQAQIMEFGQTGLTPDRYAEWATSRAATQDPRAFGFDLMTPKQRTDVLKSFKSDEERQAFIQQVQSAKQLGLIRPPGSSNGSK